MSTIGLIRLLNVAKALRESPNPDKFTMTMFGHSCQTPACALGHYCARPDLQDGFSLVYDDGCGYRLAYEGIRIRMDAPVVLEHFGISSREVFTLFGRSGCGGATTPVEAAEYIEKFVRVKTREETRS